MTPKRETFCWHVATGLCPTDAYRKSAFASGNMKDATIHNSAYKLMQIDEIRARIAEIRKEIQAESGITTRAVTDMLLADRQTAHENTQAGAAVSATMGIAKVNGLLDRAEAATCQRRNKSAPFAGVEVHHWTVAELVHSRSAACPS